MKLPEIRIYTLKDGYEVEYGDANLIFSTACKSAYIEEAVAALRKEVIEHMRDYLSALARIETGEFDVRRTCGADIAMDSGRNRRH